MHPASLILGIVGSSIPKMKLVFRTAGAAAVIIIFAAFHKRQQRNQQLQQQLQQRQQQQLCQFDLNLDLVSFWFSKNEISLGFKGIVPLR